jgi:hypothetical protein
MYGLIRHELLNVATSTLPWAVQLRSSYDTISTMGGFSESDLVVLTNTLNQDLFDCAGPDVELVVSPVNNAMAPATHLTFLQLPTPDALTRLGDSGGHNQRGISRILRPRAYLDLLAFCKPSPPDCMRAILGTGRGALPFFSLHMSHASGCHPITILWQLTVCLASLRSAPLVFGSALGAMMLSHSLVALDLRRRSRAPLCRVSAPQRLCLWTIPPGARALGMSFRSTTGLSTCLTSSCLKRLLVRGGTYCWRSAAFGREHLEIDMEIWFG